MQHRHLVDGNGRRQSWSDLRRAIERDLRMHMPRVDAELRRDAVQEGLRSLLAAIGRPWFRHASGALDYEHCRFHAIGRARQYVARQCANNAHLIHDGREGDLRDPTIYTPEETIASEDVTSHALALIASLSTEDRLLLSGKTQAEIAVELGITQQAVSERVARLKAKVRELAIDAGLLGPGGFYDTGL